ncbi:undecaprenyldiphospho-muramoylpentapeptide beta-N-acetylglucosaminyltransferase [Haliangium sp.]|uniref:undecaprenyldiphospho-muramoylpentapeptide beta-N-acetylglucosaminyltransferase n=1 Tax=Haliangium sp. TaxID=2663208 RepID=UPI003D0FEA95
MTPLRLMIAGGGTGGHLFPGVAVAEEVRARDPEAEIQFVGTRRGIEARVLPQLGWPVAYIEVSGLKTVGLMGAVRGLFRLPRALMQSRALVRDFRPDVVIGVGGYASGPLVLAARLMGTPTAILEQNSIPGLTNKILGRVVHRVFLSFEDSRRFFPARKVALTGNPIRQTLLAALRGREHEHGSDPARTGAESTLDPASAHAPAQASEGHARRPRLLVFGGSQGARALNEMVPAACALVRERGIDFAVTHQSGERELDQTRARYRDAGVDADCSAFIDDMAAAYRNADLVVARAGATTVAELGVVGLPAILIPYPHAADNHQEVNAQELVRAGAARLYRQAELDPERLAEAVAELLTDHAERARMAAAMATIGHPDAAARVADWCGERGAAGRA